MRLIRATEVQHKCGFKRTTLWRLVQDGQFPEPVHLTRKAIAWREEEVDQWIKERLPVVANVT